MNNFRVGLLTHEIRENFALYMYVRYMQATAPKLAIARARI